MNLFHSHSGNAISFSPMTSCTYNKQSQPPSVPGFFEWKLFCVEFTIATDGRYFLRLLDLTLKWLSAIKMQCVGLYGSSRSVCAISTGPHDKFVLPYGLWLYKGFCRKRAKNWKKNLKCCGWAIIKIWLWLGKALGKNRFTWRKNMKGSGLSLLSPLRRREQEESGDTEE